MFLRLAVLVLLVPLLAGAVPTGVPSATPALTHDAPPVGTSFRFAQTISVNGGFGNYSGYTETNTVTGSVTITAVNVGSPGVENATYFYAGNDTSSSSNGVSYPWTEQGWFTFSVASLDYVHGTDNQTGDNGSEVWFYVNASLPAGSAIAPLFTGMTVESPDLSYALDTAAGTNVATIYAQGNGTYTRNDDYGLFNATYVWRMYFDPTSGFIVGYDYTEVDSNGRGDGFVYTDSLGVTKTTYSLTPSGSPRTYPVTFTEAGLPSGTSWTVTFNSVPESSATSSVTVSAVANGTYLYTARLSGYTVSPTTGVLTVHGAPAGTSLTFAASSSGSSSGALVVDLVVLLVFVVVVVVVIVIVVRLARRRPRLPRHPMGGQVQYGPPPTGPAPPPISLRPADQPQIQQVVVKEVVKVNCRYCGSLIDSTAEKCPFCGATRS